MELTPEKIRIGLAKKGIPAYKMCDEIGYSKVALNGFFKNGKIRESNKLKIINYLELKEENSNVNFKNSEVIGVNELTKLNQNTFSDSFIDKLLSKIEYLTIENFSLKRELGKFKGICLTLTT